MRALERWSVSELQYLGTQRFQSVSIYKASVSENYLYKLACFGRVLYKHEFVLAITIVSKLS